MSEQPYQEEHSLEYTSAGGVRIRRTERPERYENAMDALIDSLDAGRGAALASSFEYPGRYTRWDMGFVDPLLALEGRGREFTLSALNERGRVLIPAVEGALFACEAVAGFEAGAEGLDGRIRESDEWFPEELRSRQPSVFSVIRALVDLFAHPEEPHLGLYGVFGYELAFQFEAIRFAMPRREEDRDLVLYLPDDILIVDHRTRRATRFLYDFEFGSVRTHELPRGGTREDYLPQSDAAAHCDHEAGEYADTVRVAIGAFARGDLFEVVPGQTFYEPSPAPPSEVFRRLRYRNPAPYGALLNLGEGEYLVAASPEMYVRVEGRQVETCPISGTIARGASPIEDSAQILALLNSKKDESELTMCTDVDRNDKSRVCVPGSVRVIGRRQIEIYSRLIHTVDHVVGELREELRRARRVPGACLGRDGYRCAEAARDPVHRGPRTLATTLVRRRARLRRFQRQPQHRAHPSHRAHRRRDRGGARRGDPALRIGPASRRGGDPPQGERSPRRHPAPGGRRNPRNGHGLPPRSGQARPDGGSRGFLRAHPRRLLPPDRSGSRDLPQRVPARAPARGARGSRAALARPRATRRLRLDATISMVLAEEIPLFGVCLGLQGLVLHYGGRLDTLKVPMHGKASEVSVLGGRILEGLPERFEAGRYHSLFARSEELPECLELTARSADGIVMAIEHRHLPVAAVQFHPESIMSLKGDAGIRVVENVVREFCR